MENIPKILINLVVRHEPHAIKKNTLEYVKYFIHLMEGHLSFTLGEHGLLILDKDGNLFPYLKFIKFLQLDLKEIFYKFRNNKDPQMSNSQWDECGKVLYDKVVAEFTREDSAPNARARQAGRRWRQKYWNANSLADIPRQINKININIRKKRENIFEGCINEIIGHVRYCYSDQPELAERRMRFPCNQPEGVGPVHRLPFELISVPPSLFHWQVLKTNDESIEESTKRIKEIESKYKQPWDELVFLNIDDCHPAKVIYINQYMKDILFDGESELDNTISQGRYRYIRKITGGLEGEFNYKFKEERNIRKFIKEIEMYLK